MAAVSGNKYEIFSTEQHQVPCKRGARIGYQNHPSIGLRFECWEYKNVFVFDSETFDSAKLYFARSNKEALETVNLKLTVDKIKMTATGRLGYRFTVDPSCGDISITVTPSLQKYEMTLGDENIIVKK